MDGGKTTSHKRPASNSPLEGRESSKMPNQLQTPPKNPPQATSTADLMGMMKQMFSNQTIEIRASEERVKESVALKIQELEHRIEAIEEENNRLRSSQSAMEMRVLQLERENRKLNIVASGLSPAPGQDEKTLLEKAIKDATGCQILLKNCRSFATEGKNRIVATCATWEEKMTIMANKKKFRNKSNGEPIYIDSDLPKEDREVQAKLRAIARTKRAEGRDVRVGFRKLKIDGEWITYDPTATEILDASSDLELSRNAVEIQATTK